MRHIDSLRNTREFDRVYRAHRSVSDQNLVLYKADGTGKVGIVCSKKVGNSVVRHRMARVIREAYRLNKTHISENTDIIIIAREPAKERGLTDIQESFLKLLKRLHIYENS